jgi:hypothetical protein
MCRYHESIPEMTSICLVMHDGALKLIWSQKLSAKTMRLRSDKVGRYMMVEGMPLFRAQLRNSANPVLVSVLSIEAQTRPQQPSSTTSTACVLGQCFLYPSKYAFVLTLSTETLLPCQCLYQNRCCGAPFVEALRHLRQVNRSVSGVARATISTQEVTQALSIQMIMRKIPKRA